MFVSILHVLSSFGGTVLFSARCFHKNFAVSIFGVLCRLLEGVGVVLYDCFPRILMIYPCECCRNEMIEIGLDIADGKQSNSEQINGQKCPLLYSLTFIYN